MPTVAVIGCGRFGPHLARNLAAAGARVQVTDRHPERTASVAARLHVEAVSLEQAWEADAVVVATPPSSHAALARTALAAGCDVLVEKPMTTATAEADALVAQAERTGRILMVDHTALFEPGFARLFGARDGAIRVETQRFGACPHAGWGREQALWDLAPHDLAVLDALFGPGEVADAHWTREGAHIGLNYGPVTAAVSVGWSEPSATRRRVRLQGAEPRIVTPAPGVPDPEPLAGVAKAFLEACRTREPPQSDGRLGARVVRAIDRAREACGVPRASRSRADSPESR
jgi:predicted dehydrogenase